MYNGQYKHSTNRRRERERERDRLPGDIGTFLPQNSTVSFKKELGRQ